MKQLKEITLFPGISLINKYVEQGKQKELKEYYEKQGIKLRFFPVSGKIHPRSDYLWPLPRKHKKRTEYGNKNKRHAGIDIFAKVGTPLVSPVSGVVVSVRKPGITRHKGYWGGYGPEGIAVKDEKGLTHWMGHLQNVLFNVGDEVIAGQKIAEIGKLIKAKPHVHYEIRTIAFPKYKGEQRYPWMNSIDPLRYIYGETLHANRAVPMIMNNTLRFQKFPIRIKNDKPIIKKYKSNIAIILLIGLGIYILWKK